MARFWSCVIEKREPGKHLVSYIGSIDGQIGREGASGVFRVLASLRNLSNEAMSTSVSVTGLDLLANATLLNGQLCSSKSCS